MIRVFLRERFVERRNFDPLAGIVLRRVVAADVNSVRENQRDRLHLAGQTGYPPQLLAGFGRVGGELKRAGSQDLHWALLRLINHGRGMPAHRFGPHRLPAHAPVVFVHGENKGAYPLVADQNHFVSRQDRRGAHPVYVLKRPQRRAPALAAVARVGDQTIVAEEDIDVRAVGCGAGRSRVVSFVERLAAAAGTFAAPHNGPLRPIDGIRVEFPVLECRQENARLRQDWRRMAGRKRQLPNHVGGRSELRRRSGNIGDSTSVGSTKSRPIGSQ